MKSSVRATIDYLKLCRQARAASYPVSYTTDPAWLVNMAINRRAGWPDDPSEYRGSAMPVRMHKGIAVRNSRIVGTARFVASTDSTLVYPKRAAGSTFNHLRLLAYSLNTPRRIVRLGELGEWRKLILARMPGRITMPGEDY